MKLTIKRFYESIGALTKLDVYVDEEKHGTLKMDSTIELDLDKPKMISIKKNFTFLYFLEGCDIPLDQAYDELTIIPMIIMGRTRLNYIVRSLVLSEGKLIGIYDGKEKIY